MTARANNVSRRLVRQLGRIIRAAPYADPRTACEIARLGERLSKGDAAAMADVEWYSVLCNQRRRRWIRRACQTKGVSV